MRLATPEQIQKIETLAEKDFNISPEILMENAGSLSAREIQTSFLPELQRGRVAVLCGPGNNGGDGLVTARHLVGLGFLATEVFLVGEKTSPLHQVQLKRLRGLNIKVTTFKSINDIKNFDLYVDALFGVGLSKEIDGTYFDIISEINSLSKPVVSLDIPSGLDSLTGKILGICFRSQLTLSYGLAKPGLCTANGAEFAGKIRVVPIGFPQKLVADLASTHFAINERWARRWLPVRKRTSNKFDHGRLYVVAGTPGTWGAAALCCQGAYRMGAGYVTLVADKESSEKYLGKDLGPEVLLADFSDDKIFEKADAIVVGPGSGQGEAVKKFILDLIEKKFKKVVLDADALTILSKMNNPKLPATWILTPHSGELSRLLDVSSDEIEKDRLKFVQMAANKFGCHVLLKGFRSILASPNKEVGFIVSGNAALAKAGTGDVLSGFIGALLAQDLGSFQGASTAAYIHGRISDTWIRSGKDIKSFIASDLISLLPDELHRVEGV
jgi:ADP-dependent NAD(P)H-hydrate dehydratase / NAD(P)H-hydrate epimerase